MAISPTQDDIGRSVVYQGGHPDDRDEGVITSFNERVVFVRYRSQHPSAPGQATNPDDLNWSHALWPTPLAPRPDPREDDPSREGIFRSHNCWKCDHGARPCVRGATNRCEYPRARND